MPPENSPAQYRKLPGRGRRLSARVLSGETQRMFLGPDHLLVLRRVGYEETSKRFFLSDIQAITAQTNTDRRVISVVLTLVIFLFLAIGGIAFAYGAKVYDPGMTFVYVPLAILAAYLTVNLALGPTCTVRLHTAVQIEELTALRRFDVARRCLAILIPRIQAVQGQIPSDMLLPETLATQKIRASANTRRTPFKKPPRAIGRGLHAIGFGLTVLLGATMAGDLVYKSRSKDTFDLLTFTVTMVVLLAMIIRQFNSTLPGQTRMFSWVIFAANAFAFLTMTYAAAFAIGLTAAQAGQGPPPVVTVDLGSAERDFPWITWISEAFGAVNIVLGFFGLASIRGYTLVEHRAPVESQAPAP